MLSTYLLEVADLLRDANYLFNSQAQLTRYINQARIQVAIQTGCIRAVVMGQAPFGNASNPGVFIPGAGQPGSNQATAFSTLVGVEKYAYGYAVPFLQAANQGVQGISDVIDVAVSWGGVRPSLNWLPWEELQAYARSYNVGVFSYPFVWSTNGDGTRGQVWLFPVPQMTATGTVPATQGEMEWDCSCVPSPIYSNDDYEALPAPFSGFVKFYAAHLAFLSSQRYGMANIMLNLFNDNLGISRVSSDRGKTESYYFGWQI